MPEHYFEQVQWDKNKLIDSSLKVMGLFAYGFQKIELPTKWMYVMTHGLLSVMDGKQIDAIGVVISNCFAFQFQGPRLPEGLQILQGDNVVWGSKEPRIIFHDNSLYKISPGLRNTIYKYSEYIGQEAEDVYGLRVQEKSPFTMIFPKDKYATVQQFRATLIGEG